MIPIGTKTIYGTVAAIGSLSGERYYWLTKPGVVPLVSMMPASAVEPLEETV